MFKLFLVPIFVSTAIAGLVFLWGGAGALGLVLLLSVLEVSLSFDNAVINAKVLSKMDAVWRGRFLTWGMLGAVLGARLIFPVLLVSIAAGISPFTILGMMLESPTKYAHLVAGAAPVIHAFGGAFLLMVALRYFFDEAKDVYWIRFAERRMSAWGNIYAIEIALALCAVLAASFMAPREAAVVLSSGIVGIVLFIAIEGLVHMLGSSAAHAARAGFSMFIYLNLLDAAFSLDGVIGAFALTTQVMIIMAGLGVGAYFVRTLTLLLVERRTLASLIYLEHGAYWAIFGLACCMFAALWTIVPEVVTGLVSLLFLGAAYYSSLRNRKLHGPVGL